MVHSAADSQPVGIEAADCETALGDAETTARALLAGRRALQFQPVQGADGGDDVPLARLPGRESRETIPPNWLPCLHRLGARLPPAPWGTARHPVFVTSSNFGVGSLHAFQRSGNEDHLAFGTPFGLGEHFRQRFGWGAHLAIISHACVSAHIGFLLATRQLEVGLAERALIFSFDFISPFVTGGFHALKILNGDMPAPYADRPTGSIGLGDGAAFAVLGRGPAEFRLSGQSLHNEMHHFTANRDDGAGFAACLGPVAAAAGGRRLWVKGHGTGTLEAGRLEAAAVARFFPDAPLVSWKGSLGHTLGSCGVVELAVAAAAMRLGQIPGRWAARRPAFPGTSPPSRFPPPPATASSWPPTPSAAPTPPASSAVIERHFQILRLEEPGDETADQTRERLRELFPRSAARRMTQLGMLLGSVLAPVEVREEDTIVYASGFGEGRALEDYLASFPQPSPTLFQTSIHPSAVQQVLIARRQTVGRFIPLVGRTQLAGQAVQAALTDPSPRVILCGGDERGGRLFTAGITSARAFTFALVLTREPAGALGRLRLEEDPAADGALDLLEFVDLLRDRRPLRRAIAPGLVLTLAWP